MGFSKYYYYDKPDGTDLVGKILGSVKQVIIPGVIIGVYEGWVLNTATKSATINLLTGLRSFSYLCGIAIVFANVTYMSTRMRGVDGPLNHAIGTIATTPLVKSWSRLPNVGVAQIMIWASGLMALNKGRRIKESGLEEPFTYLYEGKRPTLPNYDYYDYWTGALQPLDDYSN